MWVTVIFFMLFYRPSSAAPRHCDPSHTFIKEGVIGESTLFPWLGVLRVNLYQGNELHIALTGLVLVKEGFAITSADDVARVPRRILIEHGLAMFIPSRDGPWYCRVKDYITHMEYKFSTTSTIAVLELDPGDSKYPMKPICWPSSTYNDWTELYAFGYTDENILLEKMVYKLQFVKLDPCKEFYNRSALSEDKKTPTKYVCGYAVNSKENCIWDNGMVLASNASGYWKLLGFGVGGAGCSAPARFINLISYFPWIETATDLYDVDEFRRSALKTGFKRNMTNDVEDIPIHDVLRPGHDYRRQYENIMSGKLRDKNNSTANAYPFETEPVQTRYFSVERIESGIRIWAENITLPYAYGECSASNFRDYADETKLTAKGATGTATYKITAYDLYANNFTCIDIKLESARTTGTAKIYYAVVVDMMEGSANVDPGETPEELLKTFVVKRITTKKPPPADEWDPKYYPNLEPQYLKEKVYNHSANNINILLKLQWDDEAYFKVYIYSPHATRFTTTTTPSTTFWKSKLKFRTYEYDENERKRERPLVVKEEGRVRETEIDIVVSGSGRQHCQLALVCLVVIYFYL